MKFYLSDDDVIDPATDILLTLDPSDPNYDSLEPSAYHVSGGLASLGIHTASLLLAVPLSDPFGTDNNYQIGMIVDADENVGEADETNNRNRGQGLDRDHVEFSDNIASFPFFEGWEGGTTFDPWWEVIPGVEGRIQITSANGPFQGNYHVTLDDTIRPRCELVEPIDSCTSIWRVGPASNCRLPTRNFWTRTMWQDSVDVSVDGGNTWHQVVALTGSNSTSTYTRAILRFGQPRPRLLVGYTGPVSAVRQLPDHDGRDGLRQHPTELRRGRGGSF